MTAARWPWSLAAASLLLISLSGCPTASKTVGLQVGVYAPSLTGDVQLDDSIDTVTGEDLDISSDLNLSGREAVPYGRLDANAFGFGLNVSGFRTEQSGSGTISASFGDISAGSEVTSDLDLLLARGMFTYGMIDNSWIRIAPGLAVEAVDFTLSASEPTLGLTETLDVEQLVPALALSARINLPIPVFPIALTVDAAGIQADFADIEGLFYDIEAQLSARYELLEIFVGYRALGLDFEGVASGESFSSDLRLSGWVLGAGLRF